VAQRHYNIIRTLELSPLFFHVAGIKGIIQSWSSSHHVGAHIALFYQILANVKTQQEESWRRLGVLATSAGKKRTANIPVVVVAALLLFINNGWLAWWKTILYYYSLVAGECVNDVSAPSKRFKDL
jgi:hypothetical protein